MVWFQIYIKHWICQRITFPLHLKIILIYYTQIVKFTGVKHFLIDTMEIQQHLEIHQNLTKVVIYVSILDVSQLIIERQIVI